MSKYGTYTPSNKKSYSKPISDYGIFITFEGIDGTGKSLQSKTLHDSLERFGISSILTKEPYGDQYRKFLLEGSPEKMTPLSEALLFLSARAQNYTTVIKPALNSGICVVCDRFQDSCEIYQGNGKGVSIELLNYVYEAITESQKPNRTYLIDLDPKEALERSIARLGNKETRQEKLPLEFFERARENFLNLANKEKRFLIVDGSQDPKKISETIKKDIITFLKQKFSVWKKNTKC